MLGIENCVRAVLLCELNAVKGSGMSSSQIVEHVYPSNMCAMFLSYLMPAPADDGAFPIKKVAAWQTCRVVEWRLLTFGPHEAGR
jgi:hypothetical protein